MKKLYTFYRIYDGDENYIGVTTQTIQGRMKCHVYRNKREKPNSKLYKHFRDTWFRNYEVFDREVLTKEEAQDKEMLYIKLLQPSLNTHHVGS